MKKLIEIDGVKSRMQGACNALQVCFLKDIVRMIKSMEFTSANKK